MEIIRVSLEVGWWLSFVESLFTIHLKCHRSIVNFFFFPDQFECRWETWWRFESETWGLEFRAPILNYESSKMRWRLIRRLPLCSADILGTGSMRETLRCEVSIKSIFILWQPTTTNMRQFVVCAGNFCLAEARTKFVSRKFRNRLLWFQPKGQIELESLDYAIPAHKSAPADCKVSARNYCNLPAICCSLNSNKSLFVLKFLMRDLAAISIWFNHHTIAQYIVPSTLHSRNAYPKRDRVGRVHYACLHDTQTCFLLSQSI